MEHLDAKLEIRDIYAREIFDADGNMAVETEVLAGEGIVARASVSSRIPGAKRAKKTAEDINSFIAQELIGENVFAQEEIDRMLLSLDGSGDMSVLGTDALFSVSAAVAGAAAAALKIPLYRYLGGVRTKCMPVPVADVTGEGGCMLVPSEQMPFREQMDMCVKVSRRAGELLRERKISPPGERGVARPGLTARKRFLRQ